MDEENSIRLALLKISRCDKKPNIHSQDEENGRRDTEKRDHLAGEWVEVRRRCVFVPIDSFRHCLIPPQRHKVTEPETPIRMKFFAAFSQFIRPRDHRSLLFFPPCLGASVANTIPQISSKPRSLPKVRKPARRSALLPTIIATPGDSCP